MLTRFSELFYFLTGADPETISSSGTEEDDDDEEEGSSGSSSGAEGGRLT